MVLCRGADGCRLVVAEGWRGGGLEYPLLGIFVLVRPGKEVARESEEKLKPL